MDRGERIFCVDAKHKQVIVPVGDAAQYYLAGTYDEPLRFEFEGKTISGEPVNLNGKPLQPGDTWTGPHAGIPYVLTAAGDDVYYRQACRQSASLHRH